MKTARALSIIAVAMVSSTVCFAQGPPTSPMNAKVGVWREGFLWVLDVNGDGQLVAPPDRGYAFGGISGDIPLTGVWQGNVSSVYASAGIFRPVNGLFILDTANNGTAGTVYSFMSQQAGDIPVVGDWSGSGTTKIGIYRPSTGTWYLDYNGDGVYDAGDRTYQFGGIAGDVPVVGDWSGSGTSKIGIFRQGFLWLLDSNGDGQYDAGDAAFAYGGIAGDVPVAGDWTGSGRANVGVFRQGFLWVLDANGDQVIDAGDLGFAFGGIAGDIPVVGKWNPELNVPPSTPNTLSVTCSGVSCGSTTPGSTSQFTITYNDPVNGSNNIQYGQVWLADSAGGVHCQSEWGNNGALDLFDGNPSSASSPNTTLSDSFCSISLASVTIVSTTALAVTLNMNFLPAAAGRYNVVSVVYDLDGDASTFGTLGTFAVDAPTLSITTTSSLVATQGMSYSQTLNASGGQYPYTWSLVSGSLPAGLTLSANGTVSGTPAVAGNFQFAVRAADTIGDIATQAFTISIEGFMGASPSQIFTTINGSPAIVTITVNLPSGLSINSFLGNNFPNGVPLACGGGSGLNGSYSVTIDGVNSFTFAVSGVSAGTFSCALGGAISVSLQIIVGAAAPVITGLQTATTSPVNAGPNAPVDTNSAGFLEIYGMNFTAGGPPQVGISGPGGSKWACGEAGSPCTAACAAGCSVTNNQINVQYAFSGVPIGAYTITVTNAAGASSSNPACAPGSAQPYCFTVVPAIMLNGVDVTGVTTSVVVGQQIALTTAAPLPAGGAVQNQSWSVPNAQAGGQLGNLTLGAFPGSLSPNSGGPSAAVLTQSNSTFYWIVPGLQTVQHQVTLNNGSTLNSFAIFLVLGPTLPVVGITNGADAVDTNIIVPQPYSPNTPPFYDPTGLQVLVYEGIANFITPDGLTRTTFPGVFTAGIAIAAGVAPPLGFPGSMVFVQLLDAWNIVLTANGLQAGGCFFTGLDGGYPDPDNGVSSAAYSFAYDAPKVPLVAPTTYASQTFAARTFVMWQSNAAQSIPVPLGVVSWGWSGYAFAAGGNPAWELDPTQINAGAPGVFAPIQGNVSAGNYPSWDTFTPFGPACTQPH